MGDVVDTVEVVDRRQGPIAQPLRDWVTKIAATAETIGTQNDLVFDIPTLTAIVAEACADTHGRSTIAIGRQESLIG